MQYSQLPNYMFSADAQQITSQNMLSIKQLIIDSPNHKLSLKTDLLKVQSSLKSLKLKLSISYIFLYGLIKNSIAQTYKAQIAERNEIISDLNKQIENASLVLNIKLDDSIKQRYSDVVNSFKKLCTSVKIWDVTLEQYQDHRITRSAASSVVKKQEVRFGTKIIENIKSEYEPLWIQNANGADLYIYPCFILMYSSINKFAVIGFNEITLIQNYVRFIEDGFVPSDAKVIDRTWSKVNKDGSPDRRFNGNRQIPIAKYGEILLKTNTGLNECYHFSNYEFSEEFGLVFKAFQAKIKQVNYSPTKD